MSETKLPKAGFRKDDDIKQVTFGYYFDDGSTTGEMIIHWRAGYARLECTEDNFHVLICFPDIYESFQEATSITPDTFCDILRKLEFEELTP